LNSREVLRLLDKYGLGLVGLCSGHVWGEDQLGLMGTDPAVCKKGMERMKSLVDFASELGPGTMVNIGRSRGRADDRDLEGSWKQLAAAFRELADYALPKKVRLTLEPVNHYEVNLIYTTQEGIQMCREVNRPNFGLILDVYHMNIEDLPSIYDSLREAKDYAWHVHFSDNNRKWPGNAHMDFPGIIKTLDEIGYEGFVSAEIFPGPDPDATARSTVAYLRQYIPRRK
jgi:sugar phosphate isomerase/epimerase